MDGVRVSRTGGGGTTATSPMNKTTDHKFKIGQAWDTYAYGTSGLTGAETEITYIDNFSFHNTTKSAAQVIAMYNEGHGTNLTSDSSTKSYIRFDSETTGDLTNGEVVGNAGETYEATMEIGTLAGYSPNSIEEY